MQRISWIIDRGVSSHGASEAYVPDESNKGRGHMPPSKYALDENAKGEDVETSPSLAMIRHFAISSCLL